MSDNTNTIDDLADVGETRQLASQFRDRLVPLIAERGRLVRSRPDNHLHFWRPNDQWLLASYTSKNGRNGVQAQHVGALTFDVEWLFGDRVIWIHHYDPMAIAALAAILDALPLPNEIGVEPSAEKGSANQKAAQ